MTDTTRQQIPAFIKLAAHDLRWQMLTALAVSDHQVNELVALTQQPMNAVSYHLRQLRAAAVVQTRRSEADARDIYYSLDLNRLRDLYRQAGGALHPVLTLTAAEPVDPQQLTTSWRVLFICTHNSARSQMAEGLLRHLSGGRVSVVSAGSQPTRVHPNAIRTMDALGIDIRAQASKSLADFTAEPFDYVITVCDRAREVCPTFPGGGQQLHWGFADPLMIENKAAQRAAFATIAQRLQTRIIHFLHDLIRRDNT